MAVWDERNKCCMCADAGQHCRLDIMKSELRKRSLCPVLFIKSYIREHCEL